MPHATPPLRVRRGTSPDVALRDFLATESGSGALLVGATVVALVWANSPWSDSYNRVWETHDARHWVNDGLMAVFFLVVGLEVKRELVVGELREFPLRRATLPAVAALGGMILPAVIYLAINPSGPESHGWGVPMATDIAFAVGVLALVTARDPRRGPIVPAHARHRRRHRRHRRGSRSCTPPASRAGGSSPRRSWLRS